MAGTESDGSDAIAQVLNRIRPAIREQQAYVVGGIERPPVKLNQNESPYDLPEAIKDDLLEAFAAIPFNRYPDEQPGRLVRAYADHVGCDAEMVLAGNGSNELTYTLGLALVERGTPVVLPRPMFSLYEKVVRMHDGDLVEVPCLPDYRFDAEGLLDAVRTNRPALTVLTTPNNPTGLAMEEGEIEAIVAASDGFVVIDEAYVEFSDRSSAIELLDAYPNVIVLRTLSKAYGLAGLRIGFMIARRHVIREIMKARLPFMIDPLAEAAARTLIAHEDLLDGRARSLKAGRAALQDALASLDGVDVIPSQTNFVVFRPPVEASIVMGRLAEAGVLVRNMAGYRELSGYLRVNAGTESENNAFLVALKNALTESR
ncbi:MAG: histidinol-phosphate transaminase [Rhodothermales bacterium]